MTDADAERQPHGWNHNKLWRKAARWLVGLSASVLAVLLLGSTLDEFIARKIKGLQFTQLSIVIAREAVASAYYPAWRTADSAEFNWLTAVYGNQATLAGQPLSYTQQPFMITGVAITAGDARADGYVVMWPRQCDNVGCRYDIIQYGENAIKHQIKARNLRFTRVYLNGRAVFADVDGAIIYWNGESYGRGKP